MPIILVLNSFLPSSYSSILSSFSSSASSTPTLPSISMIPFSSWWALQFSECCRRVSSTFLFLKAACRVLFFRIKQTRSSPSHSKKSMSGSGFLGSILTMLLSTLGGGLKLFLPTLMRWSTLDNNCTLTLSRQQRSLPGLASSRWANSFWNMSTAHLNMGFWESSLKTRGELIWQGMLATQTSKKGRSRCSTSPGISTNFWACSEYLKRLDSSATMRGSISTAMTFLARSRRRAVRLPVPGPISRTTSVGRMADLATISVRMWELMRMCWPQDLLNTMPVRLTVCFSLIMIVDAGQVQQQTALPLVRNQWFMICQSVISISLAPPVLPKPSPALGSRVAIYSDGLVAPSSLAKTVSSITKRITPPTSQQVMTPSAVWCPFGLQKVVGGYELLVVGEC